jgi:hypothetical protein
LLNVVVTGQWNCRYETTEKKKANAESPHLEPGYDKVLLSPERVRGTGFILNFKVINGTEYVGMRGESLSTSRPQTG